MVEDVLIYKHKFSRVLIIGDKGNFIAKRLCELNYDCRFLVSQWQNIIFDEEFLPFKPNSFDLVLSIFSLQFVNDVVNFLQQIKSLMRRDGLFLASFCGEENLAELFKAVNIAEDRLYGGVSPRMPPTINLQTATSLLSKVKFLSPVSSLDNICIEYNAVTDLLYDLKIMGFANILRKRSSRMVSRRFVQAIIENYPQNSIGNYDANFAIVNIAGRR